MKRSNGRGGWVVYFRGLLTHSASPPWTPSTLSVFVWKMQALVGEELQEEATGRDRTFYHVKNNIDSHQKAKQNTFNFIDGPFIFLQYNRPFLQSNIMTLHDWSTVFNLIFESVHEPQRSQGELVVTQTHKYTYLGRYNDCVDVEWPSCCRGNAASDSMLFHQCVPRFSSLFCSRGGCRLSRLSERDAEPQIDPRLYLCWHQCECDGEAGFEMLQFKAPYRCKGG